MTKLQVFIISLIMAVRLRRYGVTEGQCFPLAVGSLLYWGEYYLILVEL